MAERRERQSKRNAKKCAEISRILVREEVRAHMKRVAEILKKTEKSRTEEEQFVLQQSPEVVQGIQKRAKTREVAKQRQLEVEDSDDVLNAKCEKLAEAISEARHLVVYSGAGISTAASIPDYRGPNGVWTLLQQGKEIQAQELSDAEPTFTHMCITKLYHEGRVKHVVSQNCDGLHIRSGLPRHALSELHGNMYIELCTKCQPHREYMRLFDTTERTGVRRHGTERECPVCTAELRDSIVHFGEKSPGLKAPYYWEEAAEAADSADVILCLGTSLKVLKKYPCLWSMHKPVKKRPKIYIVNLQWTPKDDMATVKINGKCDEVMNLISNKLGLSVPIYRRELDPIFSMASPLTEEEQETTSKKVLVEPRDYDKGHVEAEIWKETQQKETRQGRKRASGGRGSSASQDKDEEGISKKLKDAQVEPTPSLGRQKKGPKKKQGQKKAEETPALPLEKQELLSAVDSILPENCTQEKAEKMPSQINLESQAVEIVHTIMAPPITPPPCEEACGTATLARCGPVIIPVEPSAPYCVEKQEPEPQPKIQQSLEDKGSAGRVVTNSAAESSSARVMPNHCDTAEAGRILPRPEADIGASYTAIGSPPRLIPLQDVEKQIVRVAENQQITWRNTRYMQEAAPKQARELAQEIEDLAATQAQEVADLERQAQEVVQKHVQDMTQKQTKALTRMQMLDSSQKQAEEISVNQALAQEETMSQILTHNKQPGQGLQQMASDELQVHQLAQQAQLKAELEDKEAERKVALILAEHKRKAQLQGEGATSKQPAPASFSTTIAAPSHTADASHDGIAYTKVLVSPSQERDSLSCQGPAPTTSMVTVSITNSQEAATVLPPPTKPIHVKSRSSIIIHSSTNPDRFQKLEALPEVANSSFPAWDGAVIPVEVQAYLDEQSRLADVRLHADSPLITTIAYQPESVLVSPVSSPPVSAPASPHPVLNQTDKLQAAYIAGHQAAKEAAKAGLLPSRPVVSSVLPPATGLVQLATAATQQPVQTASSGTSHVQPVPSPGNVAKATVDWMHALERTRPPVQQPAGGTSHQAGTVRQPSEPRQPPDLQKASASWKNAMQLLERGIGQPGSTSVAAEPEVQDQFQAEDTATAADAAQRETPQLNVIVEQRGAVDLWEAARRRTAPVSPEKPPVSTGDESMDMVEETIKAELRRAVEQRAAHRSPKLRAAATQVAAPVLASIKTSVANGQCMQVSKGSIAQPGVQVTLSEPRPVLPGPSTSTVLPAPTAVVCEPRALVPRPSSVPVTVLPASSNESGTLPHGPSSVSGTVLPGPSSVSGTVLPAPNTGLPASTLGLPDPSAGPPGPERLSQAAAVWEHAKNLTKMNANMANLANAAIMQSSQEAPAPAQSPIMMDPVECRLPDNPANTPGAGLSHLARAASLEAASLSPMSPRVSAMPPSPAVATAARFPAIVQAMLGSSGSAIEQPSAPGTRNRRSKSTVTADQHSPGKRGRRRNTATSVSVAELLAITSTASRQTEKHTGRPPDLPLLDPSTSQLAQFAAIADAHASADLRRNSTTATCSSLTSNTLTVANPPILSVRSPATEQPSGSAVARSDYLGNNGTVPPVATHTTVSTLEMSSAPAAKLGSQEAADKIARSMASVMVWSTARSPEVSAKLLAYMNAQIAAKAGVPVSRDQVQPALTEKSEITAHETLESRNPSGLVVHHQQELPALSKSQECAVVTLPSSESHVVQNRIPPVSEKVELQEIQNSTLVEQPGISARMGTRHYKVNTATVTKTSSIDTGSTATASQSDARTVLGMDMPTVASDIVAASNAQSTSTDDQPVGIDIATDASEQAIKVTHSTPSQPQSPEARTQSLSVQTETGMPATPKVAANRVSNGSSSNDQQASVSDPTSDTQQTKPGSGSSPVMPTGGPVVKESQTVGSAPGWFGKGINLKRNRRKRSFK